MKADDRRTFLTIAGGVLAGRIEGSNHGVQKNNVVFEDSTNETDTSPPPDGKIADPLVVGYYPAGNSNSYPPKDVPFEKLTDVVYHGLEPRNISSTTGKTRTSTPKTPETKTKIVKPREDTDKSNLEKLREHSNKHGTRVHVSIVHDTITEGEFSDAVATETRRKQFAEETADLVREYNLDGIDIDWEPQAAAEPTRGWTNTKAENYLWLLQACREHLDSTEDGKQYHLTIAVTDSFADQLRQLREDEPRITEHIDIRGIIDRVHVMTYDYHGKWVASDRYSDDEPPTGPTGFNAPLRTPSNPEVPNNNSVADTMNTWSDELRRWSDRQTDPTDLLTTGLPFYGRRYELVSDVSDDENPGLGETFNGETVLSYGHSEIVNRYVDDSDYERYWHDEAEVPWLYSAEDNAFITYDDPESISRKVDYTLNNDFAGVMIWELTHDPEEELLNAVNGETGWPMAYGGPTRTNATSTTGPKPPLEVRWEGPPIWAGQPVVAGDTLYVGSMQSGVYAINTETGQTPREGHWPFTTSNGENYSLAVGDGTVYVGGDDGRIYAIDAETGSLRDGWTFDVDVSGWTGGIAAVDDIVYFIGYRENEPISNSYAIYAINATTGELLDGWPFTKATDRVSPPAIAHDSVYTGTRNGKVYAIDAKRGTVLDEGSWPFEAQAQVDLEARTAVTGDTVYTWGKGYQTPDKLYALNAKTGQLLDGWPYEGPRDNTVGYPAFAGDTVYTTSGREIYAIDPEKQEVYDDWSFEIDLPEAEGYHFDGTAAPLVANDTVYFSYGRGSFYAIDAKTGALRDGWPSRPVESMTLNPVVVDGAIYTSFFEGRPIAVNSA